MATKSDGGWRINGEKWFGTVGDHADFQIVLAATKHGPTLFLVDRETPGIEMTRAPRFMHTFVYEHPEFTYTDVFMPDENVLGTATTSRDPGSPGSG